MAAKENRHRSRKLLVVVVLALLALLSVANLKIIEEPLWKFIRHDLTFEDFVNTVQKGYLSDSFARKNDFLSLNGLFARLTGRRTLNTVVKLNNGMLCVPRQDMDITALANGIAGFSEYLNEQDVSFLLVRIPSKEALDEQAYPVGVIPYGKKNADKLFFQLSEKEIDILDLRPLLSETTEMLEQYFPKTDHHWNGDGAFVSFQEILNYLHESFPEGDIDLTCAQTDQWERHSIDDWFLGSWGKRVGVFFGGTDPLIWYTPKFETKMSCAVPSRGYLFRGNFTETYIRTQYIEEKSYFDQNAYDVWIGGTFPLVLHRNLNASSHLKVMMIVDSFAQPLEAFLATAFQEIDVINPTNFSECTIAEYVERTRPDIVIFTMTPFSFHSSFENFGVEEMEEVIPIREEESGYELAVQLDIEVEVSSSNQNYAAYPLDANMVYRVSFEGVEILEGEAEGVGLRLYDKTTKNVLKNMILDIAYCKATGDFSWTFRTPDTQDELELLFYAGIHGSTAGNSVIYRDVTLEKCTTIINEIQGVTDLTDIFE